MIFRILLLMIVPLMEALGLRRAVVVPDSPRMLAKAVVVFGVGFVHTAAAGSVILTDFLVGNKLNDFTAGLVCSILIGLPIGWIWGKRRRCVINTEASDYIRNLPEEKRFPSDRLAALFCSAEISSLPFVLNFGVLLLCEGIGFLSGYIWLLCINH
jgi:hypothetical protein